VLNKIRSMRTSQLVCIALFAILLLPGSDVHAQIRSNEARKLISTMAGINLPSKSVRIKSVSSVDPMTSRVVAEIETGVRMERDENVRWSAKEISVGPDRWEPVEALSTALGTSESDTCLPEMRRGAEASKLTARRARCILAELLGVSATSDSVRVRSISPLDLPLVSRPSAVVEARLQINFSFERAEKSAWRLTAVQTGDRGWLPIENLERAVNAGKLVNAQSDLQLLAAALEKFRADRGFYVNSDDESVLINHLSPYYLAKVVRVDPWNQPYRYDGTATGYTLRSDGPDRKSNTSDDLVLRRP
jgi:hypothetical protein